MTPEFIYNAEVVRVVDGDTLDVNVDLGFRVFTKLRLRLLHVDTPEVFGVKHGSEEHKAGLIASEATKAWVKEHGPHVVIRTAKGTGKYGRWLAEVGCDGGETHSLNDHLIDKGWAGE
jgi:micrococcal nuclease